MNHTGSLPFKPAAMAAAVCGALLLSPTLQAQEADAKLSEIVVTASGFEQAVEDAPASITVVPREELEKRAYRDVTDALRDVPGVVVTGGGSSSDISIRGMSASYTMLLVDGKRQNSRQTRPNSDGSGIEQGWLPPLEAIERIEVVRGPMSSLYGSDAMGGVVNVITRKVPKEWRGSVRLDTTQQDSRQSGDIYQGSFFLGGPIQNDVLGIQIYGQKSRRNEDKFVGGFNKQETTSGTVKLALTPNKNHDIVLEAGRTMQDRISTAGKSASRSSSASSYDKNVYSLSHTGRWGIGTSNTYLQREEIDNPGRKMNLKNTEFNSQIMMPLGNHLTTLGVSYQKEDLLDMEVTNGYTLGNLERYQLALFAEDEWSITERFALTGGLRMNKDENYGTHWTPRVYGVWKATEQLSVKGGISAGFKAPGLRQVSGQVTGGGGDPAWIIGNPNLKPEKSTSQEIGILWNNRNNFEASAMLFNTDFKDKITEMRSCNDTAGNGSSIVTGNCTYRGEAYKFLSELENVDKANMRGLEATATWSINQDLRLASNYTFTRSEQKSGVFAGRPLNKMPKHMLNATVDWQATGQLGMWGRVNYRSRTSESLSRTNMTQGTPSFTFLDLGLNYNINKDLKLGFGVYNIFDKEVDNATYGAQYDGRRYWLSLTAGF